MDPAYDPQRWESFYVMSGGAAAALTGLVFVAMSLHSKAITSHPLYGGRAVATLISLMSQLFLAGAVLVPGQTVTAIGIEVLIVALYFLVMTGRAVLRMQHHHREQVKVHVRLERLRRVGPDRRDRRLAAC